MCDEGCERLPPVTLLIARSATDSDSDESPPPSSTRLLAQVMASALSNRTAASHSLPSRSRHTSSLRKHNVCCQEPFNRVLVCTFQLLYSIDIIICVYVPAWGGGHKWYGNGYRLTSCPHLLHCHHVCCADVTTAPAPPPSTPL